MAVTEPDKSKTGDKPDSKQMLTPELLVRRYASAVLAICLAYAENIHDSEDIMQDVFLKAFENLKNLKAPSRVRPWLVTITRRRCIDYYRRNRKSKPLPDDAAAPVDDLKEKISRLHKAVAELPDGYREVITLYYLDGRKCSSVAKTLGISEDAVRSRLVRARFRLHKILSEKDYE